MNCEDALILLSGHLDGMNSAEETAQLRGHLEQCAECRALLKAFEEANAGLLELREPAPLDLTASVMDAVRAETSRSKRHRWQSLAVAAGLAAVIGLGAMAEWPATPANQAAPAAARSAIPMEAAVHDDPGWDAEYGLFTYDAGVVLDPQTLADDRGADLIVTHEMLSEMEVCACETLENGALLYHLESREAALKLSRLYGVELFQPVDAFAESVSYALLLP